MDEDLKASGYNKMVEEAIEEELRPIEEESEGSDGEWRPSGPAILNNNFRGR